MSHYVCEIALPRGYPIVKGVKEIMEAEAFKSEGDEYGSKWWDYYKIGGRFSGDKTIAGLGIHVQEFARELERRNVTVHPVQMGRPELHPDSQIPDVDSLWRQWFPDVGGPCPLFHHARRDIKGREYYPDDVCSVGGVPENYTCHRLIIAGPHWDKDRKELEPKFMLVRDFYNGVTWQNTAFDGNLKSVFRAIFECRRPESNDVCPYFGIPKDFDALWNLVTVDYHN